MLSLNRRDNFGSDLYDTAAETKVVKTKSLKTRKHSSRMRTARFSDSGEGRVCPTPHGGRPPPRGCRPPSGDSIPPEADPPGGRPPGGRSPAMDRQTPVKILPCPKLSLHAVITYGIAIFSSFITISRLLYTYLFVPPGNNPPTVLSIGTSLDY